MALRLVNVRSRTAGAGDNNHDDDDDDDDGFVR
jgi:hypothetical protein